jgi:hypothetical protein
MPKKVSIHVAEARASVMAWAEANGIAAQEDRGWIVLRQGSGEPHPLLNIMAELLRRSRKGAGPLRSARGQ